MKIKNAPNLKKVWKAYREEIEVSSLTEVEKKTLRGIKARLRGKKRITSGKSPLSSRAKGSPSRSPSKRKKAVKYQEPDWGAINRASWKNPTKRFPLTETQKTFNKLVRKAIKFLNSGAGRNEVTSHFILMGFSKTMVKDAVDAAYKYLTTLKVNPSKKKKNKPRKRLKKKKAKKKTEKKVLIRIGRKLYKGTRAEVKKLINAGYRVNPKFIGGKGKMTAIEYKGTDNEFYRHDFKKPRKFEVKEGALIAIPVSHTKARGILG